MPTTNTRKAHYKRVQVDLTSLFMSIEMLLSHSPNVRDIAVRVMPVSIMLDLHGQYDENGLPRSFEKQPGLTENEWSVLTVIQTLMYCEINKHLAHDVCGGCSVMVTGTSANGYVINTVIVRQLPARYSSWFLNEIRTAPTELTADGWAYLELPAGQSHEEPARCLDTRGLGTSQP